ncbi:uncharacterized protein [Manis javanica]|uniref:uncharacterized protein n=1 Tax=Manis javanica TaxID=9974 RepID=UPI003C6D1E8F
MEARAGWIAAGFSPFGGLGWFGFSLGANGALFYNNTSFCAGRRSRRCPWGARRRCRAGTETGATGTGQAAGGGAGAPPAAEAGRGLERPPSIPETPPSLPRRFCFQVEPTTDTPGAWTQRGDRPGATGGRAQPAPRPPLRHRDPSPAPGRGRAGGRSEAGGRARAAPYIRGGRRLRRDPRGGAAFEVPAAAAFIPSFFPCKPLCVTKFGKNMDPSQFFHVCSQLPAEKAKGSLPVCFTLSSVATFGKRTLTQHVHMFIVPRTSFSTHEGTNTKRPP